MDTPRPLLGYGADTVRDTGHLQAPDAATTHE